MAAMANSDLAALVTAKSEALEVEYKSWSDTSVAETSAKLARHLGICLRCKTFGPKILPHLIKQFPP
jgi:hypothetical protein